MIRPSTHAVTPTHGPRPAGKPDECFYCKAPVGDVHQPDCVMRVRTVMITYQIEILEEVPEDWTEAQMLFRKNEGAWCADNLLPLIERQNKAIESTKIKINEVAESGGCWCPVVTAKSMRDATAEEDFLTDAEVNN